MGKNLTRSTLALAVVGAMSSFAMANESLTNGAEKDTTQLQTIVLTAEEQVKQSLGASIITDKDLEKLPVVNDISEYVRRMPGVNLTGNSATGQRGNNRQIDIRGMGPENTLILVDGKPVNSRNSVRYGWRGERDTRGDSNWVPADAIESIEVLRGPAAARYGSGAMGGVVNIKTKKVTDVWTGNVELGTTIQDKNNSGDIRNGSVYLAGPIIQDKVGLQLGLNRLERKEDSYLGGFTGHTTESLNSRLTYVLNDQHDLAVEANFFTQESEATAGKTVAATGTDSASRNIRSVYALTHNGRYTDNLDSKSYIQYENSKNPDRENTVVGTKGIDLETWTANTQWNWLLGNHTLAFGGYYKDESLLDRATNRNPLVPEFDELTRWSAAAFLEDTWSLTDRFNLTLGARYDHDELYQGNISPRVYGVYNFTDQFTVKGGVSTGYKQPDIRSVTDGFYSVTGGSGSPTTTGRGIIKANPDLEPESTVTSELGFYWNNDYVNTSITGYLTQFKDRIEEIRECDSTGNADYNRNDVSTWKCSENGIPFAFISTRENIGKAELRGVEVTFDAKLAEYTTLTANYTFTDTEIKSGQFKGQPLNGMPEHVFNVTVDHDLTDALNIWSRLHVRGETTPYLGRSSMSDPIPGYNFLDVGFNYKFAPNLKGKFGVYNVLDETAQNADGEQTLDGRRYGVSFVANF